jgi:hypothetical protein
MGGCAPSKILSLVRHVELDAKLVLLMGVVNMRKFSLRELLVAVSLFALGLLAVVSNSLAATSAIVSVTSMLLIVGTSIFVVARRFTRVGIFVIVAWTYLILIFGPLSQSMGTFLFTTLGIEASYKSLILPRSTPESADNNRELAKAIYDPEHFYFSVSAQCLVTCLLGYLATLFARSQDEY